MRVAISAVSMVVLGALLVSEVAAQPGGGRGRRGLFRGNVSYLALLRVDKVREAIDLSDEQHEQLRGVARELREGREDGLVGRNFRDLSPEERRELREQRRQQAQERAKAEKQALAKVLEEAQLKRLGEIHVQVAGAAALDHPDVMAALKITEEQQAQLRDAEREARQAMFAQLRELFQSGDRDAVREKMPELRKEADAKILAVLSEEQRQKFDELKGEPIDVSLDDVFQGRGRRGG